MQTPSTITSNTMEKEPEVNVSVTGEKLQTINSHDTNAIGYELYEKAQEIYSDEEEESKKYSHVLKKIDRRIIPILCITYTLQFLDKLSLNYAAAYSLKEDLNLVGQRYSWVAAIFNFGYLFWAMPGNYIVQRVPVAKYTGFMLFSWAIILVGHVGLKNYGGALVIRFILGMFEASISPSCMAICGSFYTIKQQPIRMCIFLSFNGVATMVGALLGFGLGHATNASIKPWKLIFLVIGLLNLVWSGMFLWLCPDSPERAKFLNEEEKAVLVNHIAKNNQGMKDHHFKKYQVWEALQDSVVWMLALVGLGCGVINGGSSNFASALIKGFGFSGLQATALQLPTGAIELVMVVLGGIVAFAIKNTRCIVLFVFCIAPLGGLIGLHVIPLSNKWSLVGCAWLQFIIGGPFIMSWILLNANVSGSTKRTIANGFWFTLYAAGNIIGANIFIAEQAPRYRSGIIGLLTSYCGIMVLAILMALVMIRRNKLKRAAQVGVSEEDRKQEAILAGFKGMTDFENPGFRYSL
ncbi:conserved hypothetical protein [Lodderomyces elongisporus NRRL YB-4239]|uniref:Major facilitator superfamily (MFS) profile domain-containing protein n=1 Tax=Lodderomyces elongisporus (strain ATCC 11503 / CBS 2605 / JCM 1781 / NBRC 1676 / NRRL YB-4239) TaxID=379508 RepID=A5E1J2_LODEL|nr:conserved hypothetical protein [Lodderomyces elongisporus NRRL YB-4239]